MASALRTIFVMAAIKSVNHQVADALGNNVWGSLFDELNQRFLKGRQEPKTLFSRLCDRLPSWLTGRREVAVSPAESIIAQIETQVSRRAFFISTLADETASVAIGRWGFGSAHSIWQKPRRHLGYIKQ